MNTGSRARAFTIIEALVATVMVSVGLVACFGALASISRTEYRIRETERMQRLAMEKYDELLGTGQAASSSQGDFQDRNEDRYVWRLDVHPSGIEDLNTVTIVVEQRQPESNAPKAQVDGLIYVPPTQTEAQ